MVAFDEHWWDVRSLRFGRVDTGGLPHEGATFVAWVRWRLIDDLLQRYYLDFGLEPAFGLMGTEMYMVGLVSPTCQRSPRFFGRLCGNGVHAEDDSSMVSPLDGLPLTWAGLGGGDIHDGTWESWSDYRHAAIRVLGLADAGVSGHEGCFHRRGKALTPLIYRIALLLRTDGGFDLTVGGDGMRTVAGWDTNSADLRPITDVITQAGGAIPPGPPRYLAVDNEVYGWVALRTDGWAATPKGPIDIAGLWRRGAGEEEIAAAINELCMS